MTTSVSTDELSIPHIAIRRRRTVSAGGEVSVASTVYCPARDRSIALDECARCSHFHGLDAGVEVRETVVSCGSEEALQRSREGASLRDGRGGPPDHGTPIADIMTSDVVCVSAGVALEDAMRILVENGFGGVPVVDEAGRPIGIFSKTDVVRREHERGDTEEVSTARPRERDGQELGPGYHVCESTSVDVSEAMTPLVLSLEEGASVGQAASLMAFEGIHRLPVVTEDGQVVGLLTALDVLRWFGRRSGYLVPRGPRQQQR